MAGDRGMKRNGRIPLESVKSIPFGGGSNRRNIKKDSFTNGWNEKDSSGIPFGGGGGSRKEAPPKIKEGKNAPAMPPDRR
jgi:hypothetical protein